MDSKFVMKNKICIVAAIFLVIFLSQSKSFRFLMHTILGRSILILLILGISSSSIFLGVIAVLFAVIMINQDNNIYLEGFVEGEDMLSEFKKNLKNQSDTTLSSSSASTMDTTIITPATEGFNITEREDTIRRGKDSNQLPVNMDSNVDNVDPSSKETFTSSYSSF